MERSASVVRMPMPFFSVSRTNSCKLWYLNRVRLIYLADTLFDKNELYDSIVPRDSHAETISLRDKQADMCGFIVTPKIIILNREISIDHSEIF